MQVFSLLTTTPKASVVEIEFHSRFQIPSFQILGLPAPEIQEAKERIMAAFQASELEFPKKKVIINLAPAAVKKSGTGHDLGIALKILSEMTEREWPAQAFAWGELSLEGEVKPTGRMANLIELLLTHFSDKPPILFLHSKDYETLQMLLAWRERMKLPNPKCLKSKKIDTLSDFLTDEEANALPLKIDPNFLPDERPLDLLPLNQASERILKISLIGKHHVLLLGPKGIGKSESIRWYQALLPDSEPEQSWQRTLIRENRDLPPDFSSPVRRVHAHVRPAHLLGTFRERGYQPGELALAHGGLFVADEFLEWPRDSKECLREPLQSKKVFLTRIAGQIACPADFQMIATGNLCPCGGLPPIFRTHAAAKRFRCRCRAIEVENYLHRLSGPILDRIDLTFVMNESAERKKPEDRLQKLKAEIETSRQFARQTFQALPSELTPTWLDQNLPKKAVFEGLLKEVESLRSRHKILRVARSIQALEKSAELKEEHLFEAKCYRLPENTFAE